MTYSKKDRGVPQVYRSPWEIHKISTFAMLRILNNAAIYNTINADMYLLLEVKNIGWVIGEILGLFMVKRSRKECIDMSVFILTLYYYR